MIITIDGPTASGKSTVAADVAHILGYYYLNTGFLYRGISYLLMQAYGYSLDTILYPKADEIKHILDPERFYYLYQNGKAGVVYDGKDITSFLKTPINDQASSLVSGNPMVREALLNYQRHFTTTYNVVAEGRDTGTVVFPHADYKFFLTATLEERAKRWQHMQKQRGKVFTLQDAQEEVEQRDARDSSREVAPLTVPTDAIIIDSTFLSESAVVQMIIARIGQ